MLLIGSLGAMWAWWAKQFHETKCGSGHVCRVMAWTRQQGLVPYIGFFCRATLRTEVQNRLRGVLRRERAENVTKSLPLQTNHLYTSFAKVWLDNQYLSRLPDSIGSQSGSGEYPEDSTQTKRKWGLGVLQTPIEDDEISWFSFGGLGT